jgi:hypothetical protein
MRQWIGNQVSKLGEKIGPANTSYVTHPAAAALGGLGLVGIADAGQAMLSSRDTIDAKDYAIMSLLAGAAGLASGAHHANYIKGLQRTVAENPNYANVGRRQQAEAQAWDAHEKWVAQRNVERARRDRQVEIKDLGNVE